MRVLLINPHIFQGGAERVVTSTAYWLNKLGIDCDVITLSVETETAREGGFGLLLPAKETEYSLNISIHSSIRNLISEVEKLYLAVEAVKDEYDILNPHSYPSYWIFGLPRIARNSKVVWTCHDVFGVHGSMSSAFERNRILRTLFRFPSMLDKWIVARNIHTIVTVSKTYAREILKTYGIQPFVIPPGIDIEDYSSGNGIAFRRRYGLEGFFLAIHVGSLIPRKSQEISIRSMSILHSLVPNIRLAIIGQGPDMQRLKQLASDLNLKEVVVFTGKISDSHLKSAYKAADVNLLPTTLESFGLTPLEALASGTISIVSKESGIAEYFEEYDVGYMLKARKPSELAKLIWHVYNNPEEVETKVTRAQSILRDRFSWEHYARRLLEVYEKLVTGDSF